MGGRPRGARVVALAAPNASKRAKARRKPDPEHPKRRWTIEERLEHKGIDVEAARSARDANEASTTSGGMVMRGEVTFDDDDVVPATMETCERVAELLFRQDAEGWPRQRTPAWRYARASCVTASDAGKILSAYGAQPELGDRVLQQKVLVAAEERFRAVDLETSELARELEEARARGESSDSSAASTASTTASTSSTKRRRSRDSNVPPAIRHGNEFEAEALAHYETVHGTKCHEFGFVRHDKHYWLGASPDGVHPAGRVIEIKCPYSRPISPKTRAREHYPQIQILLEVLDLERCDFVQYKPAGRGKGRSGDPDRPAYLRETVMRDREWFASNFDELAAFARRLPTP